MDYDELVIHSYEWQDIVETAETGKSAIYGWCLNKNSERVLIKIEDYPLMLRVGLPNFIGNKKFIWRQSDADELANKFINSIKYSDPTHVPFNHQFSYMPAVYYYNRTIPILTFFFDSADAMRHAANVCKKETKFRNGTIMCEIHEDKISSSRKMITSIGSEKQTMFRYCQWFKCLGKKVENPISRGCSEYTVKWKTINPIPPNETANWNAVPGILSWDIEVYSDNPKMFPDEHNAKHVAYMISCVYRKGKGPIKRYGIIIGECNQIPEDKFPNCTLYSVNSEKELVDKFAEVVLETDPEILAGYNIFAFDYKYLDFRLKRLTLKWPNMSCLTDYNPLSDMEKIVWKSSAYGNQCLYILDCPGRISVDLLPIVKRDYKLPTYSLNAVCDHFNLTKSKMDVSAQEMFKIFERLTNARKQRKLLNNETPEDQKNKILSDFQQSVDETTKVMEYCIRDSELVLDLMTKINTWVGLIEMANICGVNIITLFTRGQQIRCVSQLYDLAFKHGFVVNSRNAPTFKYKGALVYEPIPGEYDNIICLDFSSLYPSIIRAYNISYDTFIPDGEEVDPNECVTIKFSQEEPADNHTYQYHRDEEIDLDELKEELEESEEEDKTIKPKIKMVIKEYSFRFSKKKKGLLPQLVENLVMERKGVNRQIASYVSESSLLKKYENLRRACEAKKIQSSSEIEDQMAKKSDEIKKNKSLSDYYDYMLKVSKAYENDKELYSEFLTDLQSKSKERRDRIEYLSIMETVLDKRQLGLKVSANSFYGFLGVQNGGKMPLIEAAMCVTAMGRILITQVKEYIEQKYNGIQVAGDTDSVMMELKDYITDSTQCDYWGRKLAQEITGLPRGETDIDGIVREEGIKGLFPPPLAMEFEKAMRMVIFRKKKYAAYYIGKNGKYKTKELYDEFGQVIGHKKELLVRGIILARRDSCKYVTELYTKILYNILDKKSFKESFALFYKAIKDLREDNVQIEKLSLVKTLGDSYKNASYFMKLFGDYLKRVGLPAMAGERLEYIIIDDKKEDKVGNRMRLITQYKDAMKTDTSSMHYDVMYYINNIMKGPIDQLFEVGYSKEINRMRLEYKIRKKSYTLHKPVTLIHKILSLIENENIAAKRDILEKNILSIVDYVENFQ